MVCHQVEVTGLDFLTDAQVLLPDRCINCSSDLLLGGTAALAVGAAAEYPAPGLLLLLGADLVRQENRLLEQPGLGPKMVAAGPRLR